MHRLLERPRVPYGSNPAGAAPARAGCLGEVMRRGHHDYYCQINAQISSTNGSYQANFRYPKCLLHWQSIELSKLPGSSRAAIECSGHFRRKWGFPARSRSILPGLFVLATNSRNVGNRQSAQRCMDCSDYLALYYLIFGNLFLGGIECPR